MKERKVLCHSCKEKFFKNELIQTSKTRRFCKACYEKKQAEPNDYKELIKYICNGYGQRYLTGRQFSKIKELKEKGIPYKTIQWTIYYLEVIRGRKLNGNLGLIPYYCEEAIRYSENLQKMQTQAKEINLKIEKVVVETPEEVERKDNKLKTRVVDITTL